MAPPSFLFKPTTTKPLSSTSANQTVLGLSLLRNHFNISTWLALGACLQLILSLLPIRKTYAIIPVAIFLTWRLIDHALISFGLARNVYMDGVLVGKTTALMPQPKGSAGNAGEGDICVVLLSIRCNDPNGIFAENFRHIGTHNTAMTKSLEASKPTNGFLGSTSWLNACDRTTTSELMTVYYFRSRQHVHDFAHSPVHREGWTWFYDLARAGKASNLGISHEVYDVPAGKWENIYGNMRPTGFGATTHAIGEEEGVQMWASPLVDANRGNLRSSRGRSGLDDDFEGGKYEAVYGDVKEYEA